LELYAQPGEQQYVDLTTVQVLSMLIFPPSVNTNSSIIMAHFIMSCLSSDKTGNRNHCYLLLGFHATTSNVLQH